MSVESVDDHGQKMPQPAGRAIGFVDAKFQCDAVTTALGAADRPVNSLCAARPRWNPNAGALGT